MRRTKGYWAVACAANAIAMTAVAATSPTPGTPRFWTWDDPGSDARFIEVLSFNLSITGDNPVNTANNQYDDVDTLNLAEGEVAIYIHNFGLGGAHSLMCNDGDQVDSGSISCESCDPGIQPCINSSAYAWYTRTPWASEGIAEFQAWFDDFIDRIRYRVDNDNLPEPTRIILDLEQPHPLLPNIGSEDQPRIYNAIQNDSRWSTEDLPGFGETMDELETAALTGTVWTSITDCEGGTHPNNVDWYRWYFSLVLQAVDGACDEVVWGPFATEFEDCKGSNWWSSCLFDGGTGPEDVVRTRVEGDHIDSGWTDYTYQGSAPLQSPVFYAVHEDEMNIGESTEDAALRRFTRLIDSNRYSFTTENAPNENIVPWIPLVNRPAGDTSAENELDGLYDGDFMRDVLMLSRSKNIDEFYVWCKPSGGTGPVAWGTDSDNWDEMAWLADQTWATERYGAPALQSGTYVSGYSDATLLDLSSYNYMLITPETETRILTIDPFDPEQSDDTPATEILIAFDTDNSHIAKSDGSMRIYIDMRTLSADARVGCYLWNFDTSQKDLINASLTDIDDTQRWAIRFDVADSSDYIDLTNGYVMLYVRTETYDEAETGNITGLDFVMVAGADDVP